MISRTVPCDSRFQKGGLRREQKSHDLLCRLRVIAKRRLLDIRIGNPGFPPAIDKSLSMAKCYCRSRQASPYLQVFINIRVSVFDQPRTHHGSLALERGLAQLGPFIPQSAGDIHRDSFDMVRKHSLNYCRSNCPPSLAESCTFGQFHRMPTTLSGQDEAPSYGIIVQLTCPWQLAPLT